jgi:hypothetical protein
MILDGSRDIERKVLEGRQKFQLKRVMVIANRMNMKHGLLEVLLYHHWKQKS